MHLRGENVSASTWPHPAGTDVEVTLDSGRVIRTKTRSAAWDTGSGHGLVLLDGIRAGYSLSRVRLAAPVSSPAGGAK